MLKKKANYPNFKKMEERLTGLKSIDAALELHNGIKVADGEALKTNFKKVEEELNIMLSNLDAKRAELKAVEKQLNHFSKTAFIGVKSQFGDDSAEYAKVGGKRLSERQKPQRNGKAQAKTKVKQTATA